MYRRFVIHFHLALSWQKIIGRESINAQRKFSWKYFHRWHTRKRPAGVSFINTALEVCINISYAKTKCFTDVNGLVLVTSLIQSKHYLDSKMSKDQNAKFIYANTCNAHLTINTLALNLINIKSCDCTWMQTDDKQSMAEAFASSKQRFFSTKVDIAFTSESIRTIVKSVWRWRWIVGWYFLPFRNHINLLEYLDTSITSALGEICCEIA